MKLIFFGCVFLFFVSGHYGEKVTLTTNQLQLCSGETVQHVRSASIDECYKYENNVCYFRPEQSPILTTVFETDSPGRSDQFYLAPTITVVATGATLDRQEKNYNVTCSGNTCTLTHNFYISAGYPKLAVDIEYALYKIRKSGKVMCFKQRIKVVSE